MVIFEVKVLKRGRKWFEVQETKEWVSGKMLIDSKTDLITVGEAYNILGKKEKIRIIMQPRLFIRVRKF